MSIPLPDKNLPLLYVDEDGEVTCDLACDKPWFTAWLPERRHSMVTFLLAYGRHCKDHHPEMIPELDAQLRHALDNLSQDPQEQAKRDEVHPGRDAGSGQQEAHSRANQQDQYYDRHVDPLSLRPRFKT